MIFEQEWSGIFHAWLSGGADIYSCTKDGEFENSIDDFLQSLKMKRGKLKIVFEED